MAGMAAAATRVQAEPSVRSSQRCKGQGALPLQRVRRGVPTVAWPLPFLQRMELVSHQAGTLLYDASSQT